MPKSILIKPYFDYEFYRNYSWPCHFFNHRTFPPNSYQSRILPWQKLLVDVSSSRHSVWSTIHRCSKSHSFNHTRSYCFLIVLEHIGSRSSKKTSRQRLVSQRSRSRQISQYITKTLVNHQHHNKKPFCLHKRQKGFLFYLVSNSCCSSNSSIHSLSFRCKRVLSGR